MNKICNIFNRFSECAVLDWYYNHIYDGHFRLAKGGGRKTNGFAMFHKREEFGSRPRNNKDAERIHCKNVNDEDGCLANIEYCVYDGALKFRFNPHSALERHNHSSNSDWTVSDYDSEPEPEPKAKAKPFTAPRQIVTVCGQPAVPLNAKVKTTVSGQSGISEAHYECDSGYELFGPSITKCDPKRGWEKDLPFCGTNVAYRKPVNQSSSSRAGPASLANDGKLGNENPDEQKCTETQKEVSPWWRVDLLAPQTIRVVRITTRGCCGNPPLQDLEIRVGNSSFDLQRNPLCAWYPGTVDEGTSKTFTCARPLVGQFVAIQLVGVEGSLSLCEVEVFSNDEFSPDRCAAPNLNADTILQTFSRTCYEFHVTRGESYDKAQQICKSHGGDLIHDFRGTTKDYILSELERRKTELRTQLVWIGAQKEPGYTSRTWKWVNGDIVLKPAWGRDQPNNYNGEQNCVVLDGGRNWLWNDVGCNLDYLHFICQHEPLSCGSPDSLQNTTVSGRNFTNGASITYSCPIGHALIGNETRKCEYGVWSGKAPTCKYIDCGDLDAFEHGAVILPEHRTSFSAQAMYTCHENYTLIGNENRTCTIDGWSGKQPQCLVDWCPDPIQIAGGKVETTGKRAGATAIYKCDAGYVLIGEPIITCGLGGEWSGKSPICRYVDCGTPVRPDRGNIQLINGTTTVGSIVKYQCDEDYWLVGNGEMKCTKDGKWSDDAPNCELITCETPNLPPGSFVVGYDYNIHSSIEYHCDAGHMLRGEARLKCTETGEWSGTAPVCEYIDCGPVQPIPYGSFKYTQNTTYIGSEVVYTCINSHRLQGVEKRRCLDGAAWSDETPRCEEIRCTEPIIAAHSILSVTGNDRMYGRTLIRTAENNPKKSVQTYKIGALAKYRCERGYKIIGEPLVTCEETGQWSGQVPECVYVDCDQPEKIKNGKVIFMQNATYYGSAILYECDENFKLDGISRRHCLENGTWGHEAPACVEISCDEPDMAEHVLVDAAIRTVGSVAKFSCPKGHNLIGNDTRTCLKNGRWAGKSPICKPVDCDRPNLIENGRIIIVNDSTIYGGSVEYHCIPSFTRIGPYLRKCMEDARWSGEEPRCELAASESQDGAGIGTGIAIGAAIIIILLVLIAMVVLHRNKARPVKNTENVQAAERKEDQNAAVMSYSSLETNRQNMDNFYQNQATFNTFHPPHLNNASNRSTENIYDQIPAEPYYDAPYEMQTNEDVYEPEPDPLPPPPPSQTQASVVTINGVSIR